jgi:hypothetical protein
MENRFDDLTKALAEGMPRRQALRRLAGLFGGALLASLGLAGKAAANGCPPGTIACHGKCCPASISVYNPCPVSGTGLPPYGSTTTLPGCCLNGSKCGFSLNGVCYESGPPDHQGTITCSP